jgi:hypothetical protein
MTHHKTLSLHPFIIFVSALAWYVIFYVDLIIVLLAHVYLLIKFYSMHVAVG